MSYINTQPNINTAVSPFGTIGLPNMSTSQIHLENQGTGDHALFTVPAGKKAIIVVTAYNATASTPCTPKISLDGGSTYLQTNSATNAGPTSTVSMSWDIIGNAGEVFGLTTATNAGTNIFGTAFVFDASSPLKTVRLTTFADGNNTIYTVPAGKTAFTVFGYGNILSGTATTPNLIITTTSSVAGVTANIVLNGGSVSTANRIYNATVNGVGAPLSFNTTLAAGDFINVNVPAGSAANFAIAFTNVLEQ